MSELGELDLEGETMQIPEQETYEVVLSVPMTVIAAHEREAKIKAMAMMKAATYRPEGVTLGVMRVTVGAKQEELDV